MLDWIQLHFARRPMWMNALMLFCLYMAFIYSPFDLFVKPVAVDEEVWFGVRFHGSAAKLLAVPHWAIYAAGAYGFWQLRSWMWPWASIYAGQVAIAFFVWPLLYVGGFGGFVSAIVGGGLFALLTRRLWNTREFFQGDQAPLAERYGGGTAVVTGASAGIGAAFARALAEHGLDLLLVARRKERLDELAGALEKQHGVSVSVAALDLAAPAGQQALIDATEDLDVSMLVNNAGVGYSGRFDGQDPERLFALVQLNCAAPLALTAALLPRLRERGRGAVIFTGSVAGKQPLPLHAAYAASKAFDNLLGEALWGELQGTGVDVLVLEPGTTDTEFQDVAGEIPHSGQTADEVVETALRSLGHRPSVVSGWFAWLRTNAGTRLLPRSWLVLVAKRVMERQTPDHLR
ncbi:MAG: SDR family NAD(P)-dependent oxidoreductase [Myxococcota bacterium]|nr:SDR family NAD(P)-dependent oxidoreductase [Myxococcota bacterium]